MNKIRRKALGEIRDRLEVIIGDIGNLRDEEQDYIDNMPENMQGGERAAAADEAVNQMEQAIGSIEDANSAIDEATV